MNTNKTETSDMTATQRELAELRARLQQSTQTMNSANQKRDVNAVMSDVIKVIGTFEKA